MTTENCYFLCPKAYSEVASAFAPEGSKLAHEMISDLDGFDKMPFEFELVKLSVGRKGLIKSNDLSGLKAIWYDLLPNSFAWIFMSERLMTLVNNNLSGREFLNWISVKINGNGESKIYYIPRFKKKLDVLNEEKTMYGRSDVVMKPHFSLEKIQGLSIFHVPTPYNFWKIPSGIYISETIRKSIIKEKLQGIVFEKARVS